MGAVVLSHGCHVSVGVFLPAGNGRSVGGGGFGVSDGPDDDPNRMKQSSELISLLMANYVR